MMHRVERSLEGRVLSIEAGKVAPSGASLTLAPVTYLRAIST